MPIEAAGVERDWHAVGQRHRPDLEPCTARRDAREPVADLLGDAGRAMRSLNGVPPPSRITPSPRARAQRQPRTHVDPALAVGGDTDLAGVDLDCLERSHLAERALPVALEHDVATEPQLETLERRLEGEAAAIDGRRQRQDRVLGLGAQRAERL